MGLELNWGGQIKNPRQTFYPHCSELYYPCLACFDARQLWPNNKRVWPLTKAAADIIFEQGFFWILFHHFYLKFCQILISQPWNFKYPKISTKLLLIVCFVGLTYFELFDNKKYHSSQIETRYFYKDYSFFLKNVLKQ